MLSDIKTLGRESVIYGVSSVLARTLNFLLLPFYTHYLSAQDYGIVASVFAYVAFLNILYYCGMDQAYMRYFGENRNSFLTSSLTVFSLGAVMSSLLFLKSGFLAGISGIGAGNSVLVSYCAFILLIDAVSAVGFADLRMEHKAFYYAFAKVAVIVVNIAFNLLFIAKMEMGVEGVFAANVVSSSVGLLLIFPVYLRKMRGFFDLALLKRLLVFALPLLPAGLGVMAVRVIDRPIILNILGKEAVGVYQANYKLGIFMMLFVTMFDQAWRPFFIERAGNAKAPKTFARVLTYFLVAAAWIFLAVSFFISALVKFEMAGVPLIHPAYWKGLKIVPVILAAYLLNGVYVNFLAGAVIRKKTGLIMRASFAGAFASVFFNFLLAPVFGIMGSAFAVLIAYAAMAAVLHFAVRKVYPVEYEWKRIIKILFCGVLLFGAYFTENVSGRLAALFLYPVLLWIFGFFREEEKRKIRGFFRLPENCD